MRSAGSASIIIISSSSSYKFFDFCIIRGKIWNQDFNPVDRRGRVRVRLSKMLLGLEFGAVFGWNCWWWVVGWSVQQVRQSYSFFVLFGRLVPNVIWILWSDGLLQFRQWPVFDENREERPQGDAVFIGSSGLAAVAASATWRLYSRIWRHPSGVFQNCLGSLTLVHGLCRPVALLCALLIFFESRISVQVLKTKALLKRSYSYSIYNCKQFLLYSPYMVRTA